MNHLVILIPAALLLGFIGLMAFLWSLKSGQYNDLDGDAWRILDDESDAPLTRSTPGSKPDLL
mgnify:CR=1 FL=1